MQADCTALEKAEKDLAKIQENVEKQTDEIKILVDKKRETESSLLETKTLLGSLSELRYATWKEAEQVCTGAVKEAQQIAEEIQQRQEEKQRTEEEVTALQAVLESLIKAFGIQKQEETAAKSLLDNMLQKQKSRP